MWTAALTALLAILRPIADYFSAQARLARREVQDARDTARQEVEAERLGSAYRRIEAEPPREADEVVRRLNEKFKGPAAVVLLALLLASCAFRQHEPTRLPPPVIPALTWRLCGPDVCLSVPDADKLDKFMDSYRAFRAAHERLRPTP